MPGELMWNTVTFVIETDCNNFDALDVRRELFKTLDEDQYEVEPTTVHKCYVCGPERWMQRLGKRGVICLKGKRYRAQYLEGAVHFDADATVQLEDLPLIWRRHPMKDRLHFSGACFPHKKITVKVPAFWLKYRMEDGKVEFMGKSIEVDPVKFKNGEGDHHVAVCNGDMSVFGVVKCRRPRKPKARRSTRIGAPTGGSVFRGGVRRSARLLAIAEQ